MLRFLLRSLSNIGKTFDQVGNYNDPQLKVKFNPTYLPKVIESIIIDNSILLQFLKEAQKDGFNDIQKVLGILNAGFRGTAFVTGPIAGWLLGGTFVPEGVLEKFGQKLGAVGVIMIALKVAHESLTNKTLLESIQDNAFSVSLGLTTTGAILIGGTAFTVVGVSIVVGKIASMVSDYSMSTKVSGYSSEAEKIFNYFSRYRITYVSEKREKDSKGKSYVSEKHKLSYKLTPEEEGLYFIPSAPSWNPPETFLSWGEDFHEWGKPIRNIINHHKAEKTPEKIRDDLDKFFDDYSTFYWKLPRVYLLKYDTPVFHEPGPGLKETYSKNLKENLLDYLQPFLKKHQEILYQEALGQVMPVFLDIEKDLNTNVAFDIRVYDFAEAAAGRNPYVTLSKSQYKNYRIVFNVEKDKNDY